MELQTRVNIEKPPFSIMPCEKMLFVGSCFANGIGQRFRQEAFPATVNPFGTMYNPASVMHTIERTVDDDYDTVFLTFGTNHVYIEKATGEIVDNCQKRPAALFREEVMSVDECADYMRRTVDILLQRNNKSRIVFTVSPIRYRKYGYHESQLSKATLLLATDRVISQLCTTSTTLYYFPAYEIFMDELRDYRFYASDMLHPSPQATDYVWERLVETLFSSQATAFLSEWRPIRQALEHRPLNPEGEDYRHFREQTQQRIDALRQIYPNLNISNFQK